MYQDSDTARCYRVENQPKYIHMRKYQMFPVSSYIYCHSFSMIFCDNFLKFKIKQFLKEDRNYWQFSIYQNPPFEFFFKNIYNLQYLKKGVGPFFKSANRFSHLFRMKFVNYIYNLMKCMSMRFILAKQGQRLSHHLLSSPGFINKKYIST